MLSTEVLQIPSFIVGHYYNWVQASADSSIQRITKTKHSVTHLSNIKHWSASNPFFDSRALLQLSTDRYKASTDSSIQRITKTKHSVTQLSSIKHWSASNQTLIAGHYYNWVLTNLNLLLISLTIDY